MEQIILPQEGINLFQVLSAIEDHYIEQAMARANGSFTKAALLLGLKRTTLWDKLRRKNKVGLAKAVEDPEGEFTFRKAGKGYDIFYRGEYMENKRTLQSVNAFMREKING